MTRRDRIRRFIDGELGSDERAELLADAQCDRKLGEELEGALKLEADLAALRAEGSIPPPAHLVEDTVRRAVLARERVASARGIADLVASFFRPRLLRVRVVPATVATALFFVTGFAVILLQTGGNPEEATMGALPEKPFSDPPSSGTVPLRLVLPTRGASSVAVAGDFNDWKPDEMLLEDPEGDDIFVGTIWLPPGSYSYMFVIDESEWVTDPYASAYRDDGFGNRNAVVRLD